MWVFLYKVTIYNATSHSPVTFDQSGIFLSYNANANVANVANVANLVNNSKTSLRFLLPRYTSFRILSWPRAAISFLMENSLYFKLHWSFSNIAIFLGYIFSTKLHLKFTKSNFFSYLTNWALLAAIITKPLCSSCYKATQVSGYSVCPGQPHLF